VILGIALWKSASLLIGAALILAGIIYALVRAQVLTVSRMDDHYIWIKRINKAFLDQLPELPAAP
jgi:hypothetical protein